jgi:hypothetical protein
MTVNSPRRHEEPDAALLRRAGTQRSYRGYAERKLARRM